MEKFNVHTNLTHDALLVLTGTGFDERCTDAINGVAVLTIDGNG
ncbi:hypothetical protein [Burkholderia seminalis]|nr:hypothetical protein [Burkholderia seminalis]MDN7587649.1 hypothetical protein [Burkholderia seminalis]